jgi:hypothetical protein
MDRDTAQVLGVFLLVGVALWDWWNLTRAETIIEVLKWGFQYVATIILMVNLTRGSS